MTLEELSSKIEQSDKQIAELTQLNSEFEKENISITAKVTELEKIGGEQNEKIATLEADAKQASEKHSAELAKLNAELLESKKENTQLREQSARFGAPAPKKAAQQSDEKPTMGLAEFNALPLAERNKFFRNGGKLAA